MKELKSKNRILIIILAVTAIILIFISAILYSRDKEIRWQTELAKAMMELGITAIIGGFIKILLDQHQQREQETKERKAKEEKIAANQKEFRIEILNRLRKIFDSIDSARLLIEAHKSAKSYGEKMRDSVIPSIVALYDIKRTLADSMNMMDTINIRQLRLNLHYMIAYLQALANEYRDEYLDISNLQFYEEGWKEKFRKRTVKQFLKDHSEVLSSTEFFKVTKIPGPPMQAWQRIEQLPLAGKLIIDEHNSLYKTLFVDFYEYSKRILKEQETKRLPENFKEEYLAVLDEIDLKKAKGELTKNDSLVNFIMKQEIQN